MIEELSVIIPQLGVGAFGMWLMFCLLKNNLARLSQEHHIIIEKLINKK